MTFEEIKSHCLSKTGAFETHPFGPFPVCYKVGSRIFLEWYPKDEKITVRCEPMLADFYRQSYPETVIPGYHCPDLQKPYKNTVYLHKEITDEMIYNMIDHSYEEAWRRLKKKEQKELIAINNNDETRGSL